MYMLGRLPFYPDAATWTIYVPTMNSLSLFINFMSIFVTNDNYYIILIVTLLKDRFKKELFKHT